MAMQEGKLDRETVQGKNLQSFMDSYDPDYEKIDEDDEDDEEEG